MAKRYLFVNDGNGWCPLDKSGKPGDPLKMGGIKLDKGAVKALLALRLEANEKEKAKKQAKARKAKERAKESGQQLMEFV